MDTANPILKDLNEDQLQAVTHEGGPLLILAGAGSGKTRAITRRIAWLVRERSVYPGRILSVTFTNKAAAEMKERVRTLLDQDDAPRWMGTFHSICLRILRRHADLLGYPRDFVIYDDDDQDALLRRIIKGLGLKKTGTGPFRSYIDHRKNDGLMEPDPSPAPVDRQRAEVHRL
ncbi:MAG: UvrD-helicase domain-containing protein, partial [Deltaproteobacteria bacterium]|nr:UvrD-helicase domain-containing protein [Deltaproteobacteria bacterium]